MVRVFLVDDHEVVRRGMRHLIRSDDGIEIIGESASAAEAARCSCSRATTTSGSSPLSQPAQAGYLLKSTAGSGLLAAIHAVARGESVMHPALPRVLQRVSDGMQDQRPSSKLSSLTPRERRILTLLAEGVTNRQIGNQVALSESTVKGYVSIVRAKLGVEHRAQAAVLASRPSTSSGSEAVAEHPTGVDRCSTRSTPVN